MRRPLVIVALLCPLLAAGEVRQAELDRAARLAFEGKYEAAARALEAAARQSGNRREAVLRILELQGVVFAQLGQEAKSRTAFQALLSIDPKRELSGKYTPRALKTLSEAQAWAADNAPIEMTAEPAAVDGKGKVLQIAVKVKSDPLKLGRKVRFSSRAEAGKWTEQSVEIQGAYASAGTDSEGVEWWAELLGERDSVLAQVGSPRAPVKEGRLKEKEKEREREKEPEKEKKVEAPPPPPEKEREKPADTPVVEKKKTEPPPPDAEPEPRPFDSDAITAGAVVRGSGYALLGVGMASLLAGTVMGVMSRSTTNDLKARIDTAMRDPMGTIIKLDGVESAPQQWVIGMSDRARVQAIWANGLWAVGGGLAVIGVVLAVLGRDTVEVQASASDGAGGGLAFTW